MWRRPTLKANKAKQSSPDGTIQAGIKQKEAEEITNKLLKSYDGKLIDLNEFEKGLNSRVEAYQKHEYDPYYDY